MKVAQAVPSFFKASKPKPPPLDSWLPIATSSQSTLLGCSHFYGNDPLTPVKPVRQVIPRWKAFSTCKLYYRQ